MASSDVYILGVYNGELGVDTYYVQEWEKFKELIENKCSVLTWILREKNQENADYNVEKLTKYEANLILNRLLI